MAQVNIPDDPSWQRFFKALAGYANKRPRIQRESKIELLAGKNGVRVDYQEGHFIPDETQ